MKTRRNHSIELLAKTLVSCVIVTSCALLQPSAWMTNAILADEQPVQGSLLSENTTSGDDDSSGNDTTGEEPTIAWDPPTVEVACDALADGRVAGYGAYYRVYLALDVLIEATELDEQASVVCGVPVAELVGAGQGQRPTEHGTFAFEGWSAEKDEQGRVRCSGSATLMEGTYDVRLVEVVDGHGEKASFVAPVEDDVSKLVVDTEVPRVGIVGITSGSYVRTPAEATVRVSDEGWGDVASHDGMQVVATLSKDGKMMQVVRAAYEDVQPADGGHDYRLAIPARETHEYDGTYEIRAQVADLAGNVSEEATCSLVVDTVAPVITIDFERPVSRALAPDGPIYDGPVVAKLMLREKNLGTDDLVDERGLVCTRVQASRGGSVDGVAMTPWESGGQEHEFVRSVTFACDGTFSLEVTGCDKAGNLLAGGQATPVDDEGRYVCESFVIDTTNPRVSMSCSSAATPARLPDGTTCYAKPVTVAVTVVDRNFDASGSTLTNSRGETIVPEWKIVDQAKDGEVTHTASCIYLEEAPGSGAGAKAPRAQAVDLAGHSADEQVWFVVDQTAPQVTSVDVAKPAIVWWARSVSADPLYFYHERDGVPTTLTFVLGDEYGLADAWLDDPDGAYTTRFEDVGGRTHATVSIRLKDHVTHDPDHDTAFQRNVHLYVRDAVGNVRMWSLDRTGRVVADRQDDAINVTLGGEGVYPQLLVNDVVAPHVELGGVQPGTYYRDVQVVWALVDEDGFGWLQQLAPERIVATVSKRSGDASAMRTTWNIPVSAFVGSAPRYTFEQSLADDGHYTVTAQLEDASGNRSSVALLEEFTVDKTVPTIDVSWDNEDVRNGMFYRAARTATVRLTEHNFDASRFSIQTTGVVSPWATDGDVHTCTVSFATDATPSAPHRLAIEGTDLAGNAAVPYKSADFAIDTQAPTVRVSRQVSTSDPFVADSGEDELCDRSAFSQGCRPVVRCSDEANLDAGSTMVSMTSMRGQGGSELAMPTITQEENVLTYDWGNLGASESGGYRIDGDDVYTITAKAADLAGNESTTAVVTFSLNRFGSNFFFEGIDEASEAEDAPRGVALLTSSPRIVVHEVNVSGIEDEGDARMVTKEHALLTSSIPRTDEEERTGYTLSQPDESQAQGPDGWSEYVYAIASGNFGKGSDSDRDDGGQGQYRVDVSSKDRAGNHNTTAAYWGSDEQRDEDPDVRSSTVTFTLDEDGPAIEDTVLPDSWTPTDGFLASFYVHDEFGEGDTVSVRVDGKPVEVRRGDSNEVVGEHALVRPGQFVFWVNPRPLWEPRSVSIRVGDYTGRAERTSTFEAQGFACTTGWLEFGAFLGACVVTFGCVMLVHGALARIRKGGKHGGTD